MGMKICRRQKWKKKLIALAREMAEKEKPVEKIEDTRVGHLGVKLLGAIKERKFEINPNYDGINPRGPNEGIKDLKDLGVIREGKAQQIFEERKTNLSELKKIKRETKDRDEQDRLKKEMSELHDKRNATKAPTTPGTASTPETSGSSFTESEIKGMSREKALGKIAEIQAQIESTIEPMLLRFMRNTLNQFILLNPANDVRERAREVRKIANEKLATFPEPQKPQAEKQATNKPKLSPEEEAAEQTRLAELEETRKRAEGIEEIEELDEIREAEKEVLTLDLKSLQDLLRPRLKQLSTGGKSDEVQETAKRVLGNTDKRIGELKQAQGVATVETATQPRRKLGEIKAEIDQITKEYFGGTTPPAATDTKKNLEAISLQISTINRESKDRKRTSKEKADLAALYAEAEKLATEYREAGLRYKKMAENTEADEMRKLPYMTVENEKRLREMGWTDKDFQEHTISNGAASRPKGQMPIWLLEKSEKDDLEEIRLLEEQKTKNGSLTPEEEGRLRAYRQSLKANQKELHIKRKMAEYDKHRREEWARGAGKDAPPKPLREYTLAEYEQYLKDEEEKKKSVLSGESLPQATTEPAPEPALPEVKMEDGLTSGREAWDKKIEGLRLKEKLEKRGEALEKETNLLERTGKITRGTLEGLNWLGKRYNELPKSVKIGIGVGLAGTAFATGATAAFLGAGVWRIAASSGMFVSLAEALRINYETKTGEKRSRVRAGAHIAGALAFSLLLGSGALSAAAHNVAELFSTETEITQPKKASTAGKISAIPPEQLTSDALEKSDYQNIPTEVAPAGAVMPEYSVKSGDNLYKIIRENFPEIKGLDAGKQENAIENILAKMSKDPASFGIKGGNINALKTSDIINLQKIQEIIETHQVKGEGIIERAQGLSAETVERIKGYVPPDKPSLGSFDGGVHTVDLATFNEARQETVDDAPVEKGGEDVVLNQPHGTTDDNNIYRGAESAMSGEMLAKHFETSPESLKGVVRGPDITAIEDARKMLTVKLDTTFGEKGFFGFGATSGEKSADWLAIKGKTVGELLADKSPSEPFTKAMNLVGELGGASGQIARRSETVEGFVKRALIEAVRAGKIKIT